MRTTDRKLLRDLKSMRGQVTAIVLVIMCGVATYVGYQSATDTLKHTLPLYYEDRHFADIFASVRRAPEYLGTTLTGISGVSSVETRVVANVNLEIATFNEPIAGQIVSIPEDREPRLNKLHLRQGRMIRAGREEEVILNEIFAESHNLQPGSHISAVINGRRKDLTVVGIALSPEFLIQLQPGSLFPDPARYGVLWMGRDALAAAYDMEGAFNNVVFALAPGARAEDVVDRLDVVLKRYGSTGAMERKDHPSHFFITEEYKQLQATTNVMPTIFIAVAAFLLNIVLSRLISTQREQIAVLKAFGFSNLEVGYHYMKMAMIVVAIGSVLGVLIGIWIGKSMSTLYLEYYRFPYLEYQLRLRAVLFGVGLTAGAVAVGVLNAVRRAVRLAPAEAMRPAPPASFRPTLIERAGLSRFFDQPTRMIARHLERQPIKSLLAILGIALSIAILVMGSFFVDSFTYLVDVQFGLMQQEDLTVTFTEPSSSDAVYEIRSLPGVIHAEGFRAVPVRLRHEHRTVETAIEGIPQDAHLRRLLDEELRPVQVPPQGLLLVNYLAKRLAIAPGDSVEVEVLEGKRQIRNVPVVGVVEQFLGVGAYADFREANRIAGSGAAVSGALLRVEDPHNARLLESLRRRPRVVSTVAQERAIAAFWESSAGTMITFTVILTFLAGIIAFGVVYNNARISLSERERELASMRVLGFTRGEIAYILLGEMAILTLVAIPVGCAIGIWLSVAMVQALQTDLYRIPVVLKADTFAFAATVVIACSLLSALTVRFRLNRLDLVSVLKTRE